MADKIVSVKFVSDAADLIDDFKRAAQEAIRLALATNKVKDPLKDTGTESKKTADNLKRLKSAAQAAGGRIGEMAGRAEAAAAAAGPLGVAIGAAAVAMTAGAGAAVGMATAAISLTDHLSEIVERADELALVGAGLDDDDIAQVNEAAAALARLRGTFDRLLVVVSGDSGFIGTMNKAADAANGLMLAVDALNNSTDRHAQAIVGGVKETFRMVMAYTDLGKIMTAAGSAIDFVAEKTGHLIEEQEAQAIQAIEFKSQTEALAEAEKKRTSASLEAAEKRTAAAEREFEARRKFFEAEDALFFDNLRKQEAAEAAAAEAAAEQRSHKVAEHQAMYDLMSEIDAERLANEQRVNDSRLDMAMQFADAADQIGAALLAAEINRQGDLEGKSRTTQRKVFRMKKASDLASATISTAAAVMSALAFPPGPPATIPMAALAGVMGAVQIGTIAAQQPSFHIGSRAGDLAPDEVRATLTRGEAVLTRQAQAALGLDSQGVADGNAGIAAAQTIVVQYQHDRITQRFHRDQQAMQSPTVKVGRARKL